MRQGGIVVFLSDPFNLYIMYPYYIARQFSLTTTYL